MVQGYKTINIKEEVIEKIRDLEENKKEIEEGRFNLAGFVSKVLLEELTQAVKETFDQREKNKGNIQTTDINAGITIEDLKRELVKVEIETVDKIKAKIDELKGF
jgi:undecaprenyl pyrophosphate synthase